MKHVESLPFCHKSYSKDCFKIIDSAPTPFQLKPKESMHINWFKPNLNSQVKQFNLTLTLQTCVLVTLYAPYVNMLIM